jgi:hypothetical protein
MADLTTDRTALAQDHVTKGRRIVARQLQLIGEIRARGGDSVGAEDLLSAFERTLAVFQDDLASILKTNDGTAACIGTVPGNE